MNLKALIVFFLLPVFAFSGKAQISEFSSKLPLVYINTNNENIKDEPKIIAEMGIIWNGDGQQNHTSGDFNHFQGNIGIEIRGSSSQMFPKKSYGFELRDENNEDMDFPLLGLPEEEDWILYAPYTDKTLVRNVLTYTLASQLGNYTPRCRFVELFINNEYEGVYVLMEKIKRDKNRVDIAKLKKDDTSGENLTGGYIVKIDKTTGSGGQGWYSSYSNFNSSRTFYQHEYPAYDEIEDEQADYIKRYIRDFEDEVYNQNFDINNGYQKYVDINSFIDYMIINEISKNVDGYRLSTFLYKDKNGKLNIGPIWDFNLGYGNANYYNAWETYGLQIYADLENDNMQNPFWWSVFLGDNHFTTALRCRWDELQLNLLSTERIMEVTDSLTNLLKEPIERNYQRWPIIGDWIWPNYYVGQSYNSEVSWMKNWFTARIQYLENSMPGNCDGIEPEPLEFSLKTFPNPFTTKFVMQVSSDSYYRVRIEIFDLDGKQVFREVNSVAPGINQFDINTLHLNQGMYIYRLYKGERVFGTGKIVRK